MLPDRLPDPTARPRVTWNRIAVGATVLFLLVVVAAVGLDLAAPERGVGLVTSLSLEFGALVAGGLLTQFGDPWFLLLVATLVYLVGTDRSLVASPRDGAFVLGVTFAAFSFIDLLKHAFRAPRPPGAGSVAIPDWVPIAFELAFHNITTGTGYAFPSGHALGTAAVFAALAYTLNVGSMTSRALVAAAGVLLVSATRLLLGVHFLVDVSVGLIAGLSLFAVAATLGRREPLRVFGLGVAIGVVALVVTTMAPEGAPWRAAQWLGASLGAGLAWYVVRPSRVLSPGWTAVAGIPIAALWAAIYVTSPPVLVTVIGTAFAAGTTIAAPTLAARVRDAD